MSPAKYNGSEGVQVEFNNYIPLYLRIKLNNNCTVIFNINKIRSFKSEFTRGPRARLQEFPKRSTDVMRFLFYRYNDIKNIENFPKLLFEVRALIIRERREITI